MIGYVLGRLQRNFELILFVDDGWLCLETFAL